MVAGLAGVTRVDAREFFGRSWRIRLIVTTFDWANMA
jgi:hypothetical protein